MNFPQESTFSGKNLDAPIEETQEGIAELQHLKAETEDMSLRLDVEEARYADVITEKKQAYQEHLSTLLHDFSAYMHSVLPDMFPWLPLQGWMIGTSYENREYLYQLSIRSHQYVFAEYPEEAVRMNKRILDLKEKMIKRSKPKIRQQIACLEEEVASKLVAYYEQMEVLEQDPKSRSYEIDIRRFVGREADIQRDAYLEGNIDSLIFHFAFQDKEDYVNFIVFTDLFPGSSKERKQGVMGTTYEFVTSVTNSQDMLPIAEQTSHILNHVFVPLFEKTITQKKEEVAAEAASSKQRIKQYADESDALTSATQMVAKLNEQNPYRI